MEASEPPKIMKVEEVAELLRVSPRMVQILADAGDIPAFRVGRFWRFRRDAIEALTRPERSTEASPKTENRQASPAATPEPDRRNRRKARGQISGQANRAGSAPYPAGYVVYSAPSNVADLYERLAKGATPRMRQTIRKRLGDGYYPINDYEILLGPDIWSGRF